MSKIVIYTEGTLGDHLPFVALGQALQARGHRITVVINQAMHRYAHQAGLDAVALTDIDRGPKEAQAHAWAWNHWDNPALEDHPQAPSFDLNEYITQSTELVDICRDADLLISTAIRTLGLVAHSALDIPWLTASMNPVAFWQPTLPEEQAIEQKNLRREYDLFKEILQVTFRRLGINKPVPPFSRYWPFARHILLASSPHFSLPNLAQYQPHANIDLTGFWYYQDPAWQDWQPDGALQEFCRRRPIVLTFSSQPLENPQKILNLHVAAATQAEMPLLVQRGWADFSEAHLPTTANRADIFFADFMPHDWLFAQAACAIQHGGIGSIARALRQGCPLIIEPFGNDQLYNASRVVDLGVGVAMHPFKSTVDGLVEALQEKVLTPAYRQRTQTLGAKLREEDGLTTACDMIERYINRLDPDGNLPAIYGRLTPPLTPRTRFASARLMARPARPPLHISGGRTAIPKIIHQTWKNNVVPPQLRNFQQSWHRYHPSWRYMLWTDADNRALLARHYPWFLPIYDSYPEPIMRAHAARYFILHRYGGVYADLDFECLRPMEPLLDKKQLVFGLEPIEHLDFHFATVRPFEQIVCNAWMASTPGHSFWPHLFQQLVAYHPLGQMMDSTGPFLLTRAVESYPQAAEIRLEPATRLYPITAEQSRQQALYDDPTQQTRLQRDAFAVHHWHASQSVRGRQQAVTVYEAGQPQTITSLPKSTPTNPPRISCLMVTQNRPALARRAVHCFRQQSYLNRELVIVDDGVDDSLAEWVAELGDQSIHVIRLPAESKTLGELRNIAIAQAGGEYIAQWDDDDLSHWQRLELQMRVLLATRAAACFLERQQLWWPQRERFALSNRRAWEGSMICERAALPPYPAQRQGEDTPVMEQLFNSQRVALLDYPQLYTYVYHGDNTFSAGHWDTFWDAATQQYRQPLADVLWVNLQNDIRLKLPVPPATAPKPLPPDSAPDVGAGIPRIIHQTWKNGNLPPDMTHWQQTWLKQHPGWTHYLWTDADIDAFMRRHYPWFLPIYSAYPEQIKRVDAVRYFILYHFGGVYIDLDFECFRPLEPLLAGKEIAFGLEPPAHLDLHLAQERDLRQIVCNAWMASVPGHPFWEHLFKKLVEYHGMPGPLDATGPFLLTRAYESYDQREQIQIIGFEKLYAVNSIKPWADYSPDEQATVKETAFAIHHWRGTWWRPELTAETQPETPTTVSVAAATPTDKTVLILIPVKDAMPYLPRCFENLAQLSYPHHLISLAFLESDSNDDTYAFIERHLPAMTAEFAHAALYKQDYNFQFSGPRWELGIQFKRRSIMARSRNQLLTRAMMNQDWVLWVDVDVANRPDDVIEQLLAANKEIVVPNCLSLTTGETFDCNTFKLKPDASRLDWSPHLIDGIYQPPKGFGRWYLEDLLQHDLVEVDGVGGTMLLIKADLHREGLIFPPFSYKRFIETEGLAFMARDMGYRCWGLPNLKIYHP
jgi:mannosyltransferase OCH1-like enzyme/UDP:flavonoid glycosyltransferase YjiC (YdhE family)/GT2 family glycosyltransferase